MQAVASNHARRFQETMRVVAREYISRCALCILPGFFLLFIVVLFYVGFLHEMTGWMIAASLLLIGAMSVTALIFACAGTDARTRMTIALDPNPACGQDSISTCAGPNALVDASPVGLMRMPTQHCSLRHRNESLFAGECFSTNCTSCGAAFAGCEEGLMIAPASFAGPAGLAEPKRRIPRIGARFGAVASAIGAGFSRLKRRSYDATQ